MLYRLSDSIYPTFANAANVVCIDIQTYCTKARLDRESCAI